MTRYAHKTDENHTAVRDGLRAMGWEVLDLSGVGGGVPDLCCKVGAGRSLFFEVKRPDIKKKDQALTAEQEVWWAFNWVSTRIVQSVEEAHREATEARKGISA